LVEHLIELDRRKLCLSLGYSGLFSYLCDKFNFPESSAWRYCQAVKVAKILPIVIRDLKNGDLNLTTLALMAKSLLKVDNDDKRLQLLSKCRGKSKSQIESLLNNDEKPIFKDVVKTFTYENVPSLTNLDTNLYTNISKLPANEKIKDNIDGVPVQPSPTMSSTRTITRLSFTINEETNKKLTRAKEVLSGSHPTGVDLATLLDDALEALLEKKCPQRKLARREKRETNKSETVTSASSKISQPVLSPTPKNEKNRPAIPY